MKKQLNQLRRFFARTGTRKLNAATAREVIPVSYDDDDSSNRLSGAFIVVLALHVIALVGVFAFSRMKDPKPQAPGSSSQAPSLAGASLADGAGDSRGLAPASSGQAESTQPAETPASSTQGSRATAAATTEASQAAERPSDNSRSLTRSSGQVYVVKNGDNLTRIAVAYGVRPADLMSANNLKSDELRVGQELSIPEPKSQKVSTAQTTAAKLADKAAPPKPTPTSYTVRPNETLIKISRTQGVKYDELIKLNGIKDPKKLQAGQVLKLPKKH